MVIVGGDLTSNGEDDEVMKNSVILAFLLKKRLYEFTPIERSGSRKMAYEGSTGQRCLATGRCHFDRENSKEHGELISNIIFRGIAMLYTVKRIEEDLDFGCEERPKGMPVMAIVTLTNSSGEEIRIKAEDAMLYECNINEGDKVCFDANNKLEKVK